MEIQRAPERTTASLYHAAFVERFRPGGRVSRPKIVQENLENPHLSPRSANQTRYESG